MIRFFQTRVGTWLAHHVPLLPTHIHAKALGRMYGDPSRVAEGTLEGYTEGLNIPGTMDHVVQIASTRSTTCAFFTPCSAGLRKCLLC